MRRGGFTRWVAVWLSGALVACSLPAFSEPTGATLTGVLHSSQGRQLSGARVLAANPASGHIVPSPATGADGRFSIEGLEPGAYRLAVESGGGLYTVGSPVSLEAGARRRVDLKINPAVVSSAEGEAGDAIKSGGGIWSNPLYSALIVLGSAVVVGFLVEDATQDELDASPAGGS